MVVAIKMTHAPKLQLYNNSRGMSCTASCFPVQNLDCEKEADI